MKSKKEQEKGVVKVRAKDLKLPLSSALSMELIVVRHCSCGKRREQVNIYQETGMPSFPQLQFEGAKNTIVITQLYTVTFKKLNILI